jgi:hypothetical protein
MSMLVNSSLFPWMNKTPVFESLQYAKPNTMLSLRTWDMLFGFPRLTGGATLLAGEAFFKSRCTRAFGPIGAWTFDTTVELLEVVGYIVPQDVTGEQGRGGCKKCVSHVCSVLLRCFVVVRGVRRRSY